MTRPLLESPSPLIVGITGTRATRAAVRLLKDTGAAGVLLLPRNIRTPAQTRTLIGELRRRLGRPLLFSIDHEGGWVDRFTSGMTVFPGNGALGRGASPLQAEAVGRRMGRELRALGIGLNLAPVVDVEGDRYNPGIGIRSYGRDTRLVGEMGAAFIRGQNVHGVAGCAKHFPGKGEARIDAHVDLPTIRISSQRLHRCHLPPFKAAIGAGVSTIMTSHAVWTALDRVPATYSRTITHDLLRRKLGFKGTVISDDLCMGAVTRRLPVQEAAIAAVAAGHDLIIVAHASELQRECAEALARALDSGVLDAGLWRRSRKRVVKLLKRCGGAPRKTSPRPDRKLPREIAQAAVEVLREGSAPLPLRLNATTRIRVLWPDLREIRDRFTFEGGPQGPLKHIRAGLARWPGSSRFRLTPIVRKRAIRLSGRVDLNLFFCFEARRFPGQRQALELLRRRKNEPLVALLMRSPWDQDLLGANNTVLTAHGYRNCQLDAMLEVIQ